MDNFKAVKIQDSTSFQIPGCLSSQYGGCGGSASGALARIQFEYDIKSSNITTLELTPGRYQDVSFSQDNVGKIGKGELVIRDLGYVSGDFLKNTIKQEAYFLNRLRSGQTVYLKGKHDEFLPLDFASLSNNMDDTLTKSKELEIFLKINNEYVGMRMVAQRMPDEVYEQRIRKAGKEAKKKKSNPSKEYKLRCRFNLFITNIDRDILKAKDINYMYSLRWQIELMFKSWKSTFNISKVKKMKKERLECQLYARLLLIVVCWNMYVKINNFLIKSTDIIATLYISYYKFCKTVYARLEYFMLAIIERRLLLHKYIKSLVNTSIREQQKIEAKNKTLSSIHILEILNQTPEHDNFTI